MAAGIADRLWSMDNVVEMVEAGLPKQAKREPYKEAGVMSRKTVPIVINWHGPFDSVLSASKGAKIGEVGEGLYLAVEPSGRAYAGISGNVPIRLGPHHHVLGGDLPKKTEIWIGVLASPKLRTFASSQHSSAIKLVEHVTVFFLELSENTRLTSTPPSTSIVLLNRWYDPQPDYARKAQRGHENWPDMIEYDRDEEIAKMVWFGGAEIFLDLKNSN